MAVPDGEQRTDRTERWDRLPALGGPPPPVRPPVPGARPLDRPFAEDRADEDDRAHDGDDDAERVEGPAGRGFWRTTVLGVGELLVTAGMVLLLFVAYEVYVTDFLTSQRQDELSTELRQQWEAEPAPGPGSITQVELGDAFGVLRIPRLGEDYTRVILEGTDEEQLSQGPGHYVDSAMPGEEGNLSLAGHRVGKGSPFLELDAMRAGDPIVVETADTWFVYRVLADGDPSGIPGMHVVSPSAVEVIAPTPNAAATAGPSGAYLTLTTCHPRYSARQRLVVHARLDGGAISKAQYPDGPDALYDR
ncbi:MAG: Sortase [Blastococcus sp.]|jgi:sortase A|nr:Sortase [Blastococcus sp.]